MRLATIVAEAGRPGEEGIGGKGGVRLQQGGGDADHGGGGHYQHGEGLEERLGHVPEQSGARDHADSQSRTLSIGTAIITNERVR